MHPPFFVVDHKIGPDIHHDCDDRPVKRRGQPQRLILTPSTTGWPPAPLLPAPLWDAEVVQLPSGRAYRPRPRLQVVPPPQQTLRVVIGRWLIRIGQRMILQNRPG